MSEVSREEILGFFEETPKEFENNALGKVSALSNQVIDLDKEITSMEAYLKTMT